MRVIEIAIIIYVFHVEWNKEQQLYQHVNKLWNMFNYFNYS